MKKIYLLQKGVKKPMADDLEFTIDKFTFRICTDRYYSDEGLWIKPENNHVRIGISDYLQQRSGDVAFVELKPEGTELSFGEELVVIETIKVNISLSSPLTGRVKEVNPLMEAAPEIINHDPYGDGWLVSIEPKDAEVSLEKLLDPRSYFNKIKLEAEGEVRDHDQ
jgi:glycine cleavage system H protein